MTKTTATRPARQQKVRTARLVGRILTLTEAGKPTSFHVHAVRSQLGGRGFKLEKFYADQRGADDREYYVHLGGGLDSCDCRGHQAHGHKTVCRHRAALLALLKAGKLAVLDTVVCCHCKGHGRESNGYGAVCRHCNSTGRQPTL